jgi:hypothetical protein
MQLERMHLSRVDSLDIIDYVKQSVEILMHMRQDEFRNYEKNWKLQESLRESKRKATEEPEVNITKKFKTPKNSRFFAKMRQQNEILVTPKTHRSKSKKRQDKSANRDEKATPANEASKESDYSSDVPIVPVEYEVCLQKLEQDIRKHIRTEQQLKLHVEQTQAQLDESYKESVRMT